MSRNKVCKIDDCNRKYHGGGFCQIHYNNWYRYGDPKTERRSKYPHISLCLKEGYLVFKKWKGDKTNYVHRLVMEHHLNRKLNSNELVHHLNGIRTDNRVKNLEVVSISSHISIHKRKIKSCFVCGKVNNGYMSGLSNTKERFAQGMCRRHYSQLRNGTLNVWKEVNNG